MKYIFFLAAITTSIVSCQKKEESHEIPSKNQREIIAKDIIGIWELIKINSNPNYEPYLVSPSQREFLEISEKDQIQKNNPKGYWYLSYLDEYILDSTSKVLYNTISDRGPNYYGNYDRTIKSYQIKIQIENNIKYLYRTSLRNSATEIYMKKN